MKTRREFLLWSGIAGAGALAVGIPTFKWLAQKDQEALASEFLTHGFAVSDGPRERGTGPYFASPRIDQKGRVLIGNFAGTELKQFDIPFVSHQVIQNPHQARQFFAIQKWGANAVAIDSLENRVRALELPENHHFFGHGVFMPNGQHILITAMDRKSNEGQLFVYDTNSLKLVEKYRTGGTNPHDIQISKNGKELIIIHAGIPQNERTGLTSTAKNMNSCISRLSLNSGELLSQDILDETIKAYGHFLNFDDNNILCIGLSAAAGQDALTLPACVGHLSNGKITDLMTDPLLSSCVGEALSSRKLSDTTALVTLPDSGVIALLDLKNHKVILTLPAKTPRGIVELPNNDFLISQSRRGEPFLTYSQKYRTLESLETHFQPLGPLMASWSATGAHMTEITWVGV